MLHQGLLSVVEVVVNHFAPACKEIVGRLGTPHDDARDDDHETDVPVPLLLSRNLEHASLVSPSCVHSQSIQRVQ